MMKENGVVTQADLSIAKIKTIRTRACKSCASKNNCGSSDSFDEMIITVKNSINVKKGDHVVVGIETRSMLFLSLFIYVFPVIALIFGAVIGDTIAPFFHQDSSLISMITGFLFFIFAFCLVKLKNNSILKKGQFKPFLVQKISTGKT